MKLPSNRTIRIANAVLLVIGMPFLVLAAIFNNGIGAALLGLSLGMCFASTFYSSLIDRIHANFDDINRSFNQVQQLIFDMVEERVMMEIQSRNHDDQETKRQSLH